MAKVTQLYESIEPVSGKREAILNAALQLFTERGFHGTAMPLVAEQAGVGAGTIYRYFESKEALVNTLYQDWKDFQIAFIKDNVPTDIPLRERFRIHWNRLLEFATKYQVAFSFLELHFHAPYLDEKSRAIEQQGHIALVSFFQECLQQQVVKKLAPELLGSIVWGIYISVVKAGSAECFKITQAEIDQIEACCWEAIRL